jgi:hypothetical protein
MSVQQKPHYTVSAATLADWLESQPDKWWSVDGDSRLASELDFPCPTDEIAPVIRRIGKDLLLQDRNGTPQAHGERVDRAKLDEVSKIYNRRQQRILPLSWADSDEDWLLLEDDPMT